MLVNAVTSATYSSTYVKSTRYDEAGRMTYRDYRDPAIMQTSTSYKAWDVTPGAGKLNQILSGVPGNTDSLQDLRYTYDAVGNILTIRDYLDQTNGIPQTQTYTYDNMNRLASAKVENGDYGEYALESYTYNTTYGNLTAKAGVSYLYNDTAHKHAVTHLNNSQRYWYDANGNQITRILTIDGYNVTYNLTYDAENRLTGVSGGASATFVYDGDGQRVKGTAGGVTTAYVGSHFEWTGSVSTMKRYYTAGGSRVAVRTGASTVNYLLSDHLGSTAVTTDLNGVRTSEVRYMPWGADRYTYGTTPTTMRYTGQRSEASIGLYFYGARWYDPALGRFTSPDTVVPGNDSPVNWDRYSYVRNNPIASVDPTGHWPNLSKLLSVGATICDLTATAISIVGVAVEVAAAAGVAYYNTVLNPVENSFSALSLGLVAAADAIDQNHTLTQIQDPISGQSATELTLGADTSFALGSVALGNSSFTPDAFTDTLVNLATLYYDIVRLKDEEPVWGLFQVKMVQPEYSPGYIEFTSPDEE
jgi:RHS repeat-associated protein